MKLIPAFLVAICFALLGKNAIAQSYIIETNDINSYQKQATQAEDALPHDVKIGFSDMPKKPIGLSIENSIIDFGQLTATNPVVRSHNIKILSEGIRKVLVLTQENHPLSSEAKIIPDTACDEGPCSEKFAGKWTNTLTYGFGFRCDSRGKDLTCVRGFAKPNYFKQFADLSTKELPQPVAFAEGAKNTTLKITYKVNVAGSQAPLPYLNSVYYLVIPEY